VRADELLEERTLPYDEEAVERVLRRWPVVRCCYEAGPTGFGLQRFLVERGIDCVVVAPGLVPQRPGDRVKTDSRDARKLARLLAGGLLQAIHVPSRELEAARDLVRAREDARLDRMRDRHRLSKFCLRQGRTLPTSSWTVTRRHWLSEQRFEFAAHQITFDSYLHAVDLVDARIEQLERAIRDTAGQEPWRALVARLRCLRGIDTLTALALVAEIGDFNRFRSAEELMAFVGLVPSEQSSGEKRRQGSITKVGNSHVRRLLVESAWHARRQPTVGYELARRQRGQDAVVIERAWRCQQRLHDRWRRMAGRGKPQQQIVVACARELAGFVWAIATEQPLRIT
jgi:transposase